MLHGRLRNVIVGPSFAKDIAKINRDYMGRITGRKISSVVILPTVNTSESQTAEKSKRCKKGLKFEFR